MRKYLAIIMAIVMAVSMLALVSCNEAEVAPAPAEAAPAAAAPTAPVVVLTAEETAPVVTLAAVEETPAVVLVAETAPMVTAPTPVTVPTPAVEEKAAEETAEEEKIILIAPAPKAEEETVITVPAETLVPAVPEIEDVKPVTLNADNAYSFMASIGADVDGKAVSVGPEGITLLPDANVGK